VEHLERRLVTLDSELPLELKGRHPGRLRGHQVDTQNHTCNGVFVRCMIVPAVSAVSRRHAAHRSTVTCLLGRHGSPLQLQ